MKKALALVLTVAAGTSAFAQQSLVFDSMSGVTAWNATGSTPHSMMGMDFNLGNVGAGPVTVTGLDLAFVSYVAQTLNQLEIQVSFFNTASGATTGSTAAFSNLLSTYTLNYGAFSGAASTVYFTGPGTVTGTPGIDLTSAPTTFSAGTNLGVQFLFLADTGSGLVASNNFGMAIASGVLPAVGSYGAGTAGTWGYYRNASGGTNSGTSLLGSDFRSLGLTDQGLGMRLYNTVPAPEPVSMTFLGLGAVGLIARRRHRS